MKFEIFQVINKEERVIYTDLSGSQAINLLEYHGRLSPDNFYGMKLMKEQPVSTNYNPQEIF